MSMEKQDSSAAIQDLIRSYAEEGGDISGSDDDESQMDTEQSVSPAPPSKSPPRSTSVTPPPTKIAKAVNRLVSYGADDEDEDDEEGEGGGSGHSGVGEKKSREGAAANESDNETVDKYDLTHVSDPGADDGEDNKTVEGIETKSSLNTETASSLSRSVMNMTADDVKLPPEPPGRPPKALLDKMKEYHAKNERSGRNLNDTIQTRKDFRNPSIYEKLISFIGIDEKGTNFPPKLYDPSIWGAGSYYDELAKAQKVEMDKREKERNQRTKVEFVTGTKTKRTDGSTVVEQKRKTKWDTQPADASAAIARSKPVVVNNIVGYAKK